MSDNQEEIINQYSIDVESTSALNFVLQQNFIALISKVILTTEKDVGSSKVIVRSNPECFKEYVTNISNLTAGQSLAIEKPKLIFDVKYLLELPENIKANIEVIWLSETGEILVEHHLEIDVLTIDTWGGEKQPIELLASFSQPNSSSLSPLLVSASEILKSQKQSVLNGYLDRDRESVVAQLNAVWESLLKQEIHYIVNPASFIKSGQRVRLAKQVLGEKLACCLDSTLLLSALAEQVGLDTLIVIEEGHAYLGIWLNETPNIDLLIDDIQILRKRFDLGELVFIETTLITQGASFSQAMKTASAYIKDESRHDKFYIAIDVRQARLRGIKPISAQGDTKQYLDDTEIEWSNVSIPDYEVEKHSAVKTTRVDRWLRRLLDLSLRNKLLNFKDNRYSIPLQSSDITLAKLEDALANQEGFLFKSTETISLKEVQRDNEKQYINRFVDENLARNLLFSPLDTSALEKRLVEVYRASRTAIEEGGANTLFLAIGFLEWRESERSKKIFKAPLLLIPVQITRETAKTGYRLSIYDDEPRFNSTLLQLIRQDYDLEISGLNPLPIDDSGVDVNKILHIVRKAIINIPGWEVKAEAAIGQFSFSKYLMWLDLSTRMEQLKNQAVVNHLIETPREPFVKQESFPLPSQLDQQYLPQQLFTPLSSDSSQLAAVMSAALGRTFVLSGPPGTGKSQTITNMISQCLADGKSVLFVSEKMAALDVVYRRLTQVGLAELCLQLHSSKAQKMEVLDQLRIRAEKNNDPYFLSSQPKGTEWQKLSDKLVRTRDELNQHVKILHEQHSIGWTLYAAMSDELRYREINILRYPDIDISSLTAEKRENLTELVVKAAGLASLIDKNSKHILEGFGEGISDSIWNLVWQENYKLIQDQLPEKIQRLKEVIAPWQKSFELSEKNNLKEIQEDFTLFSRIFELVQKTDLKTLKIVKDIDISSVKTAKEIVGDLQRYRQNLVGQYQPQIFQIDLNQLNFKWKEAESKFFPLSWIGKFQLRNLIKIYQSFPQRPTSLAVTQDLPTLQHIQNLQLRFAECEAKIAVQLGELWQGEASNWEELINLHAQWLDIKQIVEKKITHQTALVSALNYAKENHLDNIKQTLSEIEGLFEALIYDDKLEVVRNKKTYADVPFESLLERQQELQKHGGQWRHWLNWQAIKQQLNLSGLKPLTHTLLEQENLQDDVVKLLNINLARQWITYQFSRHPELNQFNSEQHEKRVLNFAQQDIEHQRASSEEIIYRWNKIFKDQNQFKEQWKVLNKELGKKRRHIPVRELMRQIPEVLVGLKPCLLMSPLSVAQYLDTEAKFDVVIFDEASQIPVWDAIGALARGKQSIVVGDNKQMPPTSFFGKGDSEEEVDEEVTEDLESILDECLAAQLPELVLNWHYRSRYESLIQFSNQKYYKGSLFTFPAAVAKDTAVQLHMVNGIYDKGDTRTNLGEAKAIVKFIIQHLTSQIGKDQPLTIGVVTFNMTQQKLIEDILDNELALNPELETLSKVGIEPLFVKNLENVQGDERDIILFSITYAKDQEGKLSMNFGALNRQGGQRRLNVAITRARQGLHVFSALSPEEINLSRTNSEGVRDLKDFLVFARSGQLHLANLVNKKQTKKELVQYLQTKLQDLGWGVDIGVGQGDSSVDLAIRDDLSSGNYIAGILVDGENYANAATARDRDQLKPTVLNGLGWEIFTVWTVDWWLDPDANLSKLHKQLNMLIKGENVA